MWFHSRPLGIRQHESIHRKLLWELESLFASIGNPDSQQALVHRIASIAPSHGERGKRLIYWHNLLTRRVPRRPLPMGEAKARADHGIRLGI
jgi:hypothetical protein